MNNNIGDIATNTKIIIQTKNKLFKREVIQIILILYKTLKNIINIKSIK
jgi:hypothetical protein